MKELIVKIKVDNIIDFAKLIVEKHSIEFLYKDIQIRKSSAEPYYPFNVFRDLRQELEGFNIYILVNGSKINAYVRGLMAFGTQVYLLKIGSEIDENYRVNIFDEVDDINMVSSVQKQKEFLLNWANSLS